MITVAHIPEAEALATAKVIVATLGDQDPLSRKWIAVAWKFGVRYHPGESSTHGVGGTPPRWTRPV